MTFRQSVLVLAAPVLSVALIGCQPPLEEKKDGGAPAPASGDASATPTTPAPGDAKPGGAAPTPSAEAPKDTPAPAPPTTEPGTDATPKS